MAEVTSGDLTVIVLDRREERSMLAALTIVSDIAERDPEVMSLIGELDEVFSSFGITL